VDQVKKRVNVHGELHLDAFLTEALIQYLEADEDFVENQKILIADLTELLKPLVGAS
jgi:hypothetical protein